jgi:hypothetical protein
MRSYQTNLLLPVLLGAGSLLDVMTPGVIVGTAVAYPGEQWQARDVGEGGGGDAGGRHASQKGVLQKPNSIWSISGRPAVWRR